MDLSIIIQLVSYLTLDTSYFHSFAVINHATENCLTHTSFHTFCQNFFGIGGESFLKCLNNGWVSNSNGERVISKSQFQNFRKLNGSLIQLQIA